jgi:hypothetical protein
LFTIEWQDSRRFICWERRHLACNEYEALPAEIIMKRSFRIEREFGLVVGAVFVLLGAWWIYRGKFSGIAYVVLPLGGALMLLGLVLPIALVYPNKAWMKLAEALSFVMTRLILGIVFFLIVTPIGVVKRLSGWDPLSRRGKRSASYWQPYSDRQRDPRHYEKMY